MAEHSKIEWTDATWNPITGCSVVSPGCTNCYAMKLAGTRLQHHPSRAGLTQASKAGPVWTGEVRLNAAWLDQPLRWKKPRRIFVCAHGDLFHEAVPDAWIDQVFAVMALAPHHTFQVLTKRAARMRAYMTDRAPKLARFMIDEYLLKAPDAAPRGRSIHVAWPVVSVGDVDLPDDVTMAAWPLPNVWLGVSAEDQPRADERIPELLATPAAVRFVSLEPLLGPIDLTAIQAPRYVPEDHDLDWKFSCLDAGDYYQFEDSLGVWEGGEGPWREHWLDLVIVGGESGDRPMHPAWARQIRDACAGAEVPFFFKQWGTWTPGENVDRMRGIVPVAWWFDDRWTYGEEDLANGDGHVDDEPDVYKIGKAAAGRELDGCTHDAMPEARS